MERVMREGGRANIHSFDSTQLTMAKIQQL